MVPCASLFEAASGWNMMELFGKRINPRQCFLDHFTLVVTASGREIDGIDSWYADDTIQTTRNPTYIAEMCGTRLCHFREGIRVPA